MKLFLPGLLAAVLLLAGGTCSLPAQSSNATAAPTMPDAKLTPGDTLPVTLADIQVKGYSAKVRNVPIDVKRQVYAAYGIAHWNKGEYEVGHLVPLSLGGSNSKKNLWPESYLTDPWNAHTKDQLEYRLLTLVRAGKVDMHQAQQEIARDWIAAYKQYVNPAPLAGKSKRSGFHPYTGKAAGAPRGWRPWVEERSRIRGRCGASTRRRATRRGSRTCHARCSDDPPKSESFLSRLHSQQLSLLQRFTFCYPGIVALSATPVHHAI